MLTTVIVALHLCCAFAAPYAARSTSTPRPDVMSTTYTPLRPVPSSAWSEANSPTVPTPCPRSNGAMIPTVSSRPAPVIYTAPPPRNHRSSPGQAYVHRQKTPCPLNPRPQRVTSKGTIPKPTPVHNFGPAQTATPAVVPVITPMSMPLSPSPSSQRPSPRPGSAAMSEDGSTVTAEGDNTVSAAADKKSGAASSNGDDASFAAAAPGAALGIGTTIRSHLNPTPTPCTKSAPVVVPYGSGTYTTTATPTSRPNNPNAMSYSSYVDAGFKNGYTPSAPYKRPSGYNKHQASPTTSYVIQPSVAPKRVRRRRRRCNSQHRPRPTVVYTTNGRNPQNNAHHKKGYQQNGDLVPISPQTLAPSASGTAMYSPHVAPSMSPTSAPSAIVPEPASPSPQRTIAPSPVPGSMAQSEDGSKVTAKGDNTVSIAADKDSGSAGANGEDASFAAAAPGLGLAIGTSQRMRAQSPLPAAGSRSGCTGSQDATDYKLTATSPVDDERDASDGGYLKIKKHENRYTGENERKKHSGKRTHQSNGYVDILPEDKEERRAGKQTHQSNGYVNTVSPGLNQAGEIGDSSYLPESSTGTVKGDKHEVKISPTKTPCAKGVAYSPPATYTQVSKEPTYQNTGTVGVDTNVIGNNGKVEEVKTSPTSAVQPPPIVSPSAPTPTPVPSPVPGTMAISEDGSSVNAKGDTTVSLAADTKSGSASANGKEAALAGAGPGQALGVGLSRVVD